MTPAETLRADPGRLALTRAAAQVSVSELARRLEVSRTAVQKWERSTVPPARLEATCRALGIETSGLAQELLDLVGAQQELVEARLQAQVAAAVPALVAAGQLHRRTVTTQDTAGRYRSRVLLFPGPPPVVNQRHILDSADVEGLRHLLGYSQNGLAKRLGVSRQRVANMETTHVPDGRQDQLHQVLVEPLKELDLAAARARISLSQAELARRIDKAQSTVWLWEKGQRSVPLAQAVRIGHVLAAAADDEQNRLEAAAHRILEAVTAAEPDGLATDDLFRLLARGRHRAPGNAVADQAGLARALRDHRVHWRATWTRNVAGNWRRTRKLHTGPRRLDDDPQVLTGAELARSRRQAGASQSELAAELGTVWGTVSKWEHRGRRAVPPDIAAAAADALAHLAAARADLLEQDRGRLLATAHRSPGCTRAQLLVDAGYGRATPRALRVLEWLVDQDLVHLRVTADSGRSYSSHIGVHPGPSLASAPASRPGTWLRGSRHAAGLRQRDLAAALGVTQTAIGQWERSIVPVLRVDDVETVLATLRAFSPLEPAELLSSRRTAQLSQAELGAALGVSQGAVSYWEHVGVPRDRAQTVRDLLTTTH